MRLLTAGRSVTPGVLRLPRSLQGTRHQPVLRFHLIILAASAFDLVPCSLTLESPLLLERFEL